MLLHYGRDHGLGAIFLLTIVLLDVGSPSS